MIKFFKTRYIFEKFWRFIEFLTLFFLLEMKKKSLCGNFFSTLNILFFEITILLKERSYVPRSE